MKKIIKRIFCFLGLHEWESEITHGREVVQQFMKCQVCRKEDWS